MKSSKNLSKDRGRRKWLLFLGLVCARVKEEFKKKERKSDSWV